MHLMPHPHRLPRLLCFAAVAVVILSGIRPADWQDWLLENALVAVALPLLVFGYRRMPFSDASYVSLLLFLCLHEIGAHYTYSEVPYPRWLDACGLTSLGEMASSGRNHFDRAVHFAYGVLVTPAVVELFAWRAPPRGIWRWILPVTFVMSHSLIYELVEWMAAESFGGDLGQAYLGTQGDVWDAQKDMALASLGSALAVLVLATCRWRPMFIARDASASSV